MSYGPIEDIESVENKHSHPRGTVEVRKERARTEPENVSRQGGADKGIKKERSERMVVRK